MLPIDVKPAIRIRQLFIDMLNFEGLAPKYIYDHIPPFAEWRGIGPVEAQENVCNSRIQNHEVSRQAFAPVVSLVAVIHRALAMPAEVIVIDCFRIAVVVTRAPRGGFQ
jgi:hypothetical protein